MDSPYDTSCASFVRKELRCKVLHINQTLIRMSKGFRGWIIAIAALKIMVLIGITMFANAIGTILGGLYSSSGEGVDFTLLMVRSVIASAIMLAGEVLIGEAEHMCTAKARVSIRSEIFNKLLELDVKDISRIGATNTINSSVDGVELIQMYYNRYLPGLVYSVAAPIYTFFALMNKCLPAAIILLVVSLVVTPLNNIFRNKIDKLKSDYWSGMNNLTSYYVESIKGMTTSEVYNRGDDREKELNNRADFVSRIIIRIMQLNFSSIGLSELIMNLSIFAAVIVCGVQLFSGAVTLPSALTVLMLSFGFFGSIRKLQWIEHEAIQGIAASGKIAEVLEVDSSKEVSSDTGKKNDFKGILLENVTFSYDKKKEVLKGVDIRIPENSTVALAGESGCGKSTVVNMLLRFYDSDSGRITLDGRDYLSIDTEALRKKIIMVPQQVYIFSGSIRDNLAIATADISDEHLMTVLDQVRLGAWVRSLPEGLDANVGDAGSKLSGGQRQKIGIARAILSDAPYIVFDESTSSVDETNENEIWECIKNLGNTRTLVIISHRLSTIRNADTIYVFEDGKVTESGSHDELMENNGIYSKLVTQQNELENNQFQKQPA